MSVTNTGFTIPELIIAITVSTILLGMLFGPLNDLYTSSTSGLRSIVQTTNTRGALRSIEHNITLADKFLASNNNNATTDDNLPDIGNSSAIWTWQGATNDPKNRVLITQNYGSDSNGNAVLTKTACDVTTPQTIQYVYFVQNKSLYRRTLVAKTYPTGCNGSVVDKRTCPPAKTRSSYCKANDALIASGVTRFTVDYYASASTSTPLDNSCGNNTYTCYTNNIDSTVPNSACTVVITLGITTGVGNNAIETTSQLRITRINGTACT